MAAHVARKGVLVGGPAGERTVARWRRRWVNRLE